MNSFKFNYLVFIGLCLNSCTEDPTIQLANFKSQPVIYGIIDSNDTVHYIRVARVFSGLQPPFETAQIRDSLRFDSVKVSVSLKEIRTGKNIEIPVRPWEIGDGEPGMFDPGGYQLFRFEKDLLLDIFHPYEPWTIMEQHLLFSQIKLVVEVPGLPVARCSTAFVEPPQIWSPDRAQTDIFIYPGWPLRIQWSGDAWNEIDVTFDLKEQFQDTTIARRFRVQKTSEVFYNGKYNEIRVPYELIVQTLAQNLEVRQDIIRRYFGPFRIDLLTGNQTFYTCMEFRNGINDFNFNPYDNIENGIGMLAAKSSFIKSKMYLDQPSRLKFAEEPVLRKFRITEY
ncbi:MAG: hypothetical protein A2X22_09870 [Bacteroidetes bacterium GWF2_49_14]|nr:MAG: hypothetical protein A2X22_09870 [Bacteroidetes bacterium GWF2_49_14]HBB91368.1 hypothetical protein [Bacteroidales bacterium]